MWIGLTEIHGNSNRSDVSELDDRHGDVLSILGAVVEKVLARLW